MTPYDLLRRRCGLSQAEAAAFHGVRLDTIKSWCSGRNRPAAAVLAELRSLHARIERVAAEALAAIDGAPDAEQIELGFAADDHEAQALGWPCVGAQAASLGLVCLGAFSSQGKLDHCAAHATASRAARRRSSASAAARCSSGVRCQRAAQWLGQSHQASSWSGRWHSSTASRIEASSGEAEGGIRTVTGWRNASSGAVTARCASGRPASRGCR